MKMYLIYTYYSINYLLKNVINFT